MISLPKMAQECLQAAKHAAGALGRAHSERAYEDCMVNYFYRKRMPYLRQRNFYQNVQGEIIHVGVADLEVDHRIVLELKANVKDISDDHKAQLMRYLRAANQDSRRRCLQTFQGSAFSENQKAKIPNTDQYCPIFSNLFFKV